MDRIELTGWNSPLKNKKEKKTSRKGAPFSTSMRSDNTSVRNDFSLFLTDVENVSIEELLDNIHEAGEKLIEKPFISSIKEYKNAVRQFVGYIVKKAYEAETDVQTRRFLKNGIPVLDEKKWVKIKVVDEKLEKLASYIVQSQKNQLTILKKIEEIEGILVDLMG